ncbi:hypothetical protein N657DRAFT_705974 [Parathielavia appendiculata]|uniref:Uncharacterized protein n=1 Tax=Parathielavia appendiculata TaxID=2587402 RepID=A0AAN6TSK0_9PEZI|nr:hypothetical protein N657DRAFT_705974 [Parathielavia appendiculata]
MDIFPQIYIGEEESAGPVRQFPGYQFPEAYYASLSFFLHYSPSLLPPELHGDGVPSPSLIEDMVFPNDIGAVGTRPGSIYSTTEAGSAIMRTEMPRPAATPQPLTGYAVSQRNDLSARADRNEGPDLGSRRPPDISWLAADALPPPPVSFEWGASTLPPDNFFLLPWAAASPSATVSGIPFEFASSVVTPSRVFLEGQCLTSDEPSGLVKPGTELARPEEPTGGDARFQADAGEDHKPFSCPWDGWTLLNDTSMHRNVPRAGTKGMLQVLLRAND